MIRFLPSFIGSKQYWVEKLLPYKDSDIVELFSGSAAISANLAKTAILNDSDPMIYKIFSNYDKLIAPDVFTAKDYYDVRFNEDWWRYIFCLQGMAFSGLFRYSKRGFNVPMKKGYIESVSFKDELQLSKKRFSQINPTITNVSYENVPIKELAGKVVISDPPYQKTKDNYVVYKRADKFNYDNYWDYVKTISKVAKSVIVFDTDINLKRSLGTRDFTVRKMRVNGKYNGGNEAMCILGENLLRTK